MQKILGYLRRACDDFGLIEDGDRIAVGLSGGKDSTALMYAMHLFSRFSPARFTVCAITVDLGLEPFITAPTEEFCRNNGIEYDIIRTDIGRIVFDIRKEPNPCSLCAKMRRGALNNAARDAGCNKVALGHHRDDLIDTFFLSLMYESRIYALAPKTYLSRTGLTVIRPLILTPEKETKRVCRQYNLPVLDSPCPTCGQTKREEAKRIIGELQKAVPDVREKVFSALHNRNYHLWDD
ncbi:MAG TPA: ATP-binding protein [Clostridia bacterium]|nr:ATP-binding protein [Clostridia bacterium]